MIAAHLSTDDLVLLRERRRRARQQEPVGARIPLRDFIRSAWHVVEPATAFTPGFHIDAISDHLEAVTDGTIRNLIINIPPRHMKSLNVCVFWPCWEWTFQPHIRWLFSSYNMALAIRDSLKCRRLILSPWYQQHYGGVFQLTGDQNQKGRFENNRTGYRLSTHVGAGTGEGGDRLVVDDPLDAMDADSEAVRTAANDWWDNTMSSRGNDPKTVAKVIVMQRLHERDLTGHVKAKAAEGSDHYEHLCLPAEYEPRVLISGIGWSDPRTAPGDLLWPERFGPKELSSLKTALKDERAIAGQLQQRPAPAGGAIFKRERWAGKNRYDAADEALLRSCVGRWIFLDSASKTGDQNSHTAHTVFELLPDYRVLDRETDQVRLEVPQLPGHCMALARRFNGDGKLRGFVIEDKASGIGIIQTLQQAAEDWLQRLIVPFQPSGDKEYRARQAAIWCELDAVLLPHPSALVPWLAGFAGEETAGQAMGELFAFPGSAFNDRVDTWSMGIIFLEHYLSAGYHARQGTRTEAA